MKHVFVTHKKILSIAVLCILILGAQTAILYSHYKYDSHFGTPHIVDIAPVLAEQKIQTEQTLFIDVRGPEAYKAQHAIGSSNIPLHLFYFKKDELPKNTDTTIILICSGGVASGVAYSYLEHFGFRNILRVEGGIEKWIEAGLPRSQGL